MRARMLAQPHCLAALGNMAAEQPLHAPCGLHAPAPTHTPQPPPPASPPHSAASSHNPRPPPPRPALLPQGSPFNILTLLAALFVLVPVAGLAFAYTSYGVLWG